MVGPTVAELVVAKRVQHREGPFLQRRTPHRHSFTLFSRPEYPDQLGRSGYSLICTPHIASAFIYSFSLPCTPHHLRIIEVHGGRARSIKIGNRHAQRQLIAVGEINIRKRRVEVSRNNQARELAEPTRTSIAKPFHTRSD